VGARFVLKIAKSDEDPSVLDLQNTALRRVALRAPAVVVPRVQPARHGPELVQAHDGSGRPHWIRLMAWLEGAMFADIASHDELLLASFGTVMAQVDQALDGLSHPAMHRVLHWDIRHADQALVHLPLLARDEQQIVAQLMDHWSALNWQSLRSGTIHGDANDHNVLVREGRVVGLIDFGDLVHTAIVCDLAIAMAYAMLDEPRPLDVGSTIVRAYHAHFPLAVAEVDALYPLIAARLCMSVCYAAHNARAKTGDAYQQVSAAPAWRLLRRLVEWPPEAVRSEWRQACVAQ
jgi:Ser/Thr protein kinase RdoA (MazF antagonist)